MNTRTCFNYILLFANFCYIKEYNFTIYLFLQSSSAQLTNLATADFFVSISLRDLNVVQI